MADSYTSDEEQIEALKKWWRENGQSTVIAIVLAAAGVFGWQAWQQQKQETIYAASSVYQNLINAAGANQNELNDKQIATVKHLADTLKTDFPGSSYALFGALYKAKYAVIKKDYASAEQELRWVIDNSKDQEINLQAALRLARVLYAQGKYQDALPLLNADALGYAAAYEELKGDIYYQQGEKQQSLAAYQKAQALNQQNENATESPLLDMKLQQLQSELAGG